MDLRNKTTSEFRTVFHSPFGVPNSEVPLYIDVLFWILIANSLGFCAVWHKSELGMHVFVSIQGKFIQSFCKCQYRNATELLCTRLKSLVKAVESDDG